MKSQNLLIAAVLIGLVLAGFRFFRSEQLGGSENQSTDSGWQIETDTGEAFSSLEILNDTYSLNRPEGPPASRDAVIEFLKTSPSVCVEIEPDSAESCRTVLQFSLNADQVSGVDSSSFFVDEDLVRVETGFEIREDGGLCYDDDPISLEVTGPTQNSTHQIIAMVDMIFALNLLRSCSQFAFDPGDSPQTGQVTDYYIGPSTRRYAPASRFILNPNDI